MNCPGCGYDNKPDALVCNLCQRMLRKAEPRPRPPREQPPPAPAASDVPAVEPTHRRATPWPILALGLVLMLWGTTLIVKRWRTYTLPPYPKNASPAEALTAPGYAYVRWDRALVRKDEVVYRVGHFPAKFVGADPRVGFEAASPSELLAKRAQLTGSYVRVGTVLPMLQSFILTQKRVTTGPGGQDSHEETIGRRIYAPVIGTGARLWVLSKWFPPQVDVAAEPWLVQGAYAGVLRELGHDPEYARLEREWHRSGLGTRPRDAVVLVDGPPHTKDDVARWYPLGPSNEL
ncbi:MAG: hypothetical protein HYV09_37615, partial [Deltaproteobacteria bacterium]|nr:hypothetical protein [Deltaproteobacteria bacterium]